MSRRKIIKDYKAHFGLQDVPFRMLGLHDKAVIDWAEQLVNNCNMPNISGSFYRPKTRGELYDALKNGIKCECVTSNVEFTSLALQSLNAMGCGDVKFKTYPSENIGWSIYESVS